MIEITNNISICEDSLVLKFSRSSGAGGQNVNKVNTRVTVFLDVANCAAFSDVQKKQILERLATRADKKGVIRVISQRYRTQGANRRAAVERLGELLREALKNKPTRRRTTVPYAARRRRLEEKRQRGDLKKQRAKRYSVEDSVD